MSVDLYFEPLSPACRVVILGARAAGVKLNLKLVDYRRATPKPELLKANPQHILPTIDDDGFFLGESRAILGYLVDQYAENDSLYPKDPKQRALVNQRLDFDNGTLYRRLLDCYKNITTTGALTDPHVLSKLEDAFEILSMFLEGEEWVAGSADMTIADIAIQETVTSTLEMRFTLNKYPNVARWLDKCKRKIPTYDKLSREDRF